MLLVVDLFNNVVCWVGVDGMVSIVVVVGGVINGLLLLVIIYDGVLYVGDMDGCIV